MKERIEELKSQLKTLNNKPYTKLIEFKRAAVVRELMNLRYKQIDKILNELREEGTK